MKKATVYVMRFVVVCALLFITNGVWGADAGLPVQTAPGAQPQHTAIRSVRVNDIDVSYRITGEGDPLLLITGYSATMDIWDTHLIRELSSRFKVIVFDNRGIGKTTASDKPFSVELFAEDALGLMNALKIEKAHILGWSMGTFIAMEMILKYPERVDKVVLYAGSCRWKGKDVVQANPVVSAKLMDLSGSHDERGARLVSILFPKKWLDDHPDFLKNIPVSQEAPSLAVIERQGKAIESWAGVCGRLDSIAHPTLLITGAEDMVIPPENSLLMASRIRNSWLVRIPGGHSAMYQYPKTFSRCIITFLEGEKE